MAALWLYAQRATGERRCLGRCTIPVRLEGTHLVEAAHSVFGPNGEATPGLVHVKISCALRPGQRRMGIADFDLMRVIGRGSFGKVMLTRKKDTGRLYALKVLKKSTLKEKRGPSRIRAAAAGRVLTAACRD